MDPSFNWGRNSVPNKVNIHRPPTATIPAMPTDIFRWAWHLSKKATDFPLMKRTKKLFFSRTFRFSNMDDMTGTKVNVNNKAPNKANPKVYANGENIFPSTFWKEKIGISAVIIMSLEKNTARAFSLAVCRISPIFDIRLKVGIPTSLAFRSSATNIPSTMTTAPSIIIPKSMAPMESRLADMPMTRKQIKANSRAKGITTATTTVVRQSAMNINTMNVTNKMPSTRLRDTVWTARFTRFSRS